MRLLDTSCAAAPSDSLRISALFGWDQPPPVDVLSEQLLALQAAHAASDSPEHKAALCLALRIQPFAQV
jgi:hypothetical protein